MHLYLYAPLYGGNTSWVYSVSTNNFYANISTKTMLENTKDLDIINIHKKDNLDKALLLISLGLSITEIQEYFDNENNMANSS